jgi:hypothetical protein
MRPLIYICSPLSDMPIEYLNWVGKMNDTALELTKQGWAPYVPGNDLLFLLRAREIVTKEMLLEIDVEFIRAAAAIYVIAKKHHSGVASEGVAFEIQTAGQFGKPVLYTLHDAEAELKGWKALHEPKKR